LSYGSLFQCNTHGGATLQYTPLVYDIDMSPVVCHISRLNATNDALHSDLPIVETVDSCRQRLMVMFFQSYKSNHETAFVEQSNRLRL